MAAWESDRFVNMEREAAGIDLLVIRVLEEEEEVTFSDRAIVLGLAADAAKPEVPRADRSIILICQLSSRRW